MISAICQIFLKFCDFYLLIAYKTTGHLNITRQVAIRLADKNERSNCKTAECEKNRQCFVPACRFRSSRFTLEWLRIPSRPKLL